jgi:hypothetical protein
VSCPTTNACSAVGSYFNSSKVKVTLAERWNGTSWAIQTTPNPTGSSDSSLSGVSCPTTNACTAVGYYFNSSNGFVMLAEGWNGTSWAIQTTPNPPGGSDSSLTGVSCLGEQHYPFAVLCTAVGKYFNSSGVHVSLAERWNGTSWAIQSTPNPTGGTLNFLSGVSCPTTSACSAVGSYFNGSSVVTLAEGWNGTSWAIQSTPNPGAHSSLSEVSCPTTSACTAVGDYFNSNNVDLHRTLAEHD